jgi:hypothetical protein
MSTEARPVSWRHLTTGASVWAPFGSHGWRAATVIGLGKNRAERTVCQLLFENGGQGKRQASQLFWRKIVLHGADKPSIGAGMCPAMSPQARLNF